MVLFDHTCTSLKRFTLAVIPALSIVALISACGNGAATVGSSLQSASDHHTDATANTTIPALVGTEWVQEGHFGYLRIEADNVGGSDGCNSFGGMDPSGQQGTFVFGANGLISVGKTWALVTTLRACFPEPHPAIELPNHEWRSYVLSGQNLTIETTAGVSLRFTRRTN